MKSTVASIILALSALPLTAQHHDPGHAQGQSSPYAAEENRDIKSLSGKEQLAWLEGQGQGLARAAELNGYPGPMHVLELAALLALTLEQSARSRELMDRHKAQVRDLGARLVDAERRLDLLFREKLATAREVARLTSDIGQLLAAIRSSHLSTHLEQAALLTPGQIAAYASLRGYTR